VPRPGPRACPLRHLAVFSKCAQSGESELGQVSPALASEGQFIVSLGAPVLADFDNAPVAEISVGVEYEPLDGWNATHYGLLWEPLGSEYPKTESQWSMTSLPHFPVAIPFPGPAPNIRCLFIDGTGNKLILVQSDRLFANWRRMAVTDEYPHYASVRPRFVEVWSELGKLLEAKSLGPAKLGACEVTYMNHLELGHGWSSVAELPTIIRGWAPQSVEVLNNLCALSMTTMYQVGDDALINIALQPAIRHRDGQEIQQLTVSARVRPTSDMEDDMLVGLDRAHELAVTAFVEHTSDNMHRWWKRKDSAWTG
jgi:uncharacterized protein (TIGR04255 family)